MARRKIAAKRQILPDPIFGSELLAKFINRVMKNGKKSIAEKIVYRALDKVRENLRGHKHKVVDQQSETAGSESGEVGGSGAASNQAVLDFFTRALENLSPAVEVRSRRVGGSTYQVPVEVRAVRRVALAMRWLVEAANQRGEKTMALRLAAEIMAAYEKHGSARKKLETVLSMAESNKAYSHFRW